MRQAGNRRNRRRPGQGSRQRGQRQLSKTAGGPRRVCAQLTNQACSAWYVFISRSFVWSRRLNVRQDADARTIVVRDDSPRPKTLTCRRAWCARRRQILTQEQSGSSRGARALTEALALVSSFSARVGCCAAHRQRAPVAAGPGTVCSMRTLRCAATSDRADAGAQHVLLQPPTCEGCPWQDQKFLCHTHDMCQDKNPDDSFSGSGVAVTLLPVHSLCCVTAHATG